METWAAQVIVRLRIDENGQLAGRYCENEITDLSYRDLFRHPALQHDRLVCGKI